MPLMTKLEVQMASVKRQTLNDVNMAFVNRQTLAALTNIQKKLEKLDASNEETNRGVNKMRRKVSRDTPDLVHAILNYEEARVLAKAKMPDAATYETFLLDLLAFAANNPYTMDDHQRNLCKRERKRKRKLEAMDEDVRAHVKEFEENMNKLLGNNTADKELNN